MISESGFLRRFKEHFLPELYFDTHDKKEEDSIEKEEKHQLEENDVRTYKNRVDKLEKLIKAKENSIKTFITKNDALTSELLGVKDLLYEKDMAFRSVSDSLNIVVERCNHKSKQVQEQMETNENLSDQNAALKSEVEIMKRKVSDLESEVVDYQKLNEENNDAYKNQKQLLRKREEELLELRREFEEKIDMQSESTASVRKKAERCSNESEELREQLKKLKEKFDKEKDCHFTEIQNLEQEKTELIQKMSSTENQLKKSREEYNSMANNLTYTESDFHALQLKFNSLTKDHASLKTDLHNHEKRVNSLTTENKSVKKELENLKIDHDTLVQQKVSHNSRIQNLQREIEDEKDRGLKNSHIIEDLKRQVQNQQNELAISNARSNEFAKSSLEEEQDMRRKWLNRIKDAEDEVNRLTAKLKLSEKNRSEQCAELEQVNYDLASTKRNLTSLEKKHHNTEVMLEEHVNLDQENRDKIETMKRRMNEYQSQIVALKQEKEEDLRQQRELRNKIKTLTERVEDLEHEEEISERKKQEMTRQVARLQEQVETANGTVAELSEDLEKANTRADKTHKDSLLAMEQNTNVLAEKDEEIEMVKKTCRGTINLLKNQLEAAELEISKLVLIKKELEGEIMLLQGDLDEAEATVNELNNEIPRQQDILEQLNVSLGEATSRCEALQDALVRADLKCTQLSTRNEELEDQVTQGETQKRLTDQDNIDLHNKIAEQSAKSEALLDTIAKVEAQLEAQSGIMEAMEADKSNWELERRKMRELITTLEADNQHLEEVRIGLESSENKIKCRLRDTISEHEDIMKSVKNNHRSRTRALESRVAELEGNLEEETERRTTLEKALKRLERLLKELELQAMEDTQTIERQVEQIASVNNRNKQLKTQFADAEARITSLQQKLRKLTTEVEESEGRNATMTKLLSTPAASRCPTPLRQSRGCLASRPDTAMSWDHEGVDHQDLSNLSNDLKQPDKLYTALMRNSVMGSRPSSRLISPEVESILLSGRNSPVGPLSILSGRNSPAAQLSPGLQRAVSPAGSIGNQPKSFQFEESLTKDFEIVNQIDVQDGGKTEDTNGEEIKSTDASPKKISTQEDKIPEVILTEEGKSPVSLAKEVASEEVKPLWETEVIVPEKDGDQNGVPDAVNGH
ncbi:hypothetical protein ACHWQZ_G005961 [Mnemiopsis leidyi]